MKKGFENVKIVFILLFILLILPNISSLSNESIQTEQELREIKFSINEMQENNIPVQRVNESYNEALQIYSAQKELEKSGKNADYKIVLEKIQEIREIKEKAEKAKDELRIFNRTYFNAKEETNLSEMQEDYEKIISSFYDERFEETPDLINKGYSKISDIQSSQTTVNLFYSTTSNTIKNFIKNTWKELSIGFIIFIILLLIFQRTISRFLIKKKLDFLHLRKHTLNNLIKRTQRQYFQKGDISKEEYDIKIKKFNEILRDIERQIPLLKEKKAKVNKKKQK